MFGKVSMPRLLVGGASVFLGLAVGERREGLGLWRNNFWVQQQQRSV